MTAIATKFELGRTAMSRGIEAILTADESLMAERFVDLGYLIWRHSTGDWGDLDPEDKQANEDAVELGNRILSAYQFQGHKVWIITEADRSETTVLLPEEY